LLAAGRSEATITLSGCLFHKAVEWSWLDKTRYKVVKYRNNNIRTASLEPVENVCLIQTAKQDEWKLLSP
jgi:hypothetical protein